MRRAAAPPAACTSSATSSAKCSRATRRCHTSMNVSNSVGAWLSVV
jgi:hypothetical protein